MSHYLAKTLADAWQLCNEYNVINRDAHNAEADVEATWMLAGRLLFTAVPSDAELAERLLDCFQHDPMLKTLPASLEEGEQMFLLQIVWQALSVTIDLTLPAGMSEPAESGVKKRKDPTCGACGTSGHTSRSKQCPQWTSTPALKRTKGGTVEDPIMRLD